ncbi:hypothetical protein GCM10022206_23610 [Streptomyces chiangmaiensis]
MMLIGIDPHKSTHTATAVDPETNRDQASIRIDGRSRSTSACWTGPASSRSSNGPSRTPGAWDTT